MKKLYFILSVQTQKETKPKHGVICVNTVWQIFYHYIKLLSSPRIKTFGLTKITKKDYDYYSKKLETKCE